MTILKAARELFAARGYTPTTLRAVAAAAGVQPSLIHHYFGSKRGLFLECVDFPVDLEVVLPAVLAQGQAQLGTNLANLLVGTWSDPDARTRMMALLRASAELDTTSGLLKQFLENFVLPRLSAATGAPGVVLALAAGQSIGVLLLRHVVQLDVLDGIRDEEVIAVIAPILQAAIDTRPEHGRVGKVGPSKTSPC